MILKNKNSEERYEVHCIFWGNSRRHYYATGAYKYLDILTEDDCDIIDSSIGPDFVLVRTDDFDMRSGGDMIVREILTKEDSHGVPLLDRLIEDEPGAREEFEAYLASVKS